MEKTLLRVFFSLDNFLVHLVLMGPQQETTSKAYYANGSAAAAATARKEKVVRYKECQRNHAASIGGYAVDGCREFMPSAEDGTAAALLCAACGCHRSFHKREVQPECDCSSARH